MTTNHLMGLLICLIGFNICLIVLRLLLGLPFLETALLAVFVLNLCSSLVWQGWLRWSTGS